MHPHVPVVFCHVGPLQAKLDDTQKKLDATNNKLRLAEDDHLEKSEERGDAAEDKVMLLVVLLMLLVYTYSDTPYRMVTILTTAAPSVDTSRKTLPTSRVPPFLLTPLSMRLILRYRRRRWRPSWPRWRVT